MNKQLKYKLSNIKDETTKETIIDLIKEMQLLFGRQVGGKEANHFNLKASAKIGKFGSEVLSILW